QSMMQLGQVEPLAELLLELRQQYPQEPDVHHLLGWARTQQKRLGEATEHFRDAARLKPDAAGTLNNLGLVLLEQERLGEALEAFKAAVAAQPQYVEALTNLSLTLCRAGLCQHALFFLEEALKLDPKCADAHHYLGFAFLTLGQVDKAERHL